MNSPGLVDLLRKRLRFFLVVGFFCLRTETRPPFKVFHDDIETSGSCIVQIPLEQQKLDRLVIDLVSIFGGHPQCTKAHSENVEALSIL